jgi:hypothetical protein
MASSCLLRLRAILAEHSARRFRHGMFDNLSQSEPVTYELHQLPVATADGVTECLHIDQNVLARCGLAVRYGRPKILAVEGMVRAALAAGEAQLLRHFSTMDSGSVPACAGHRIRNRKLARFTINPNGHDFLHDQDVELITVSGGSCRKPLAI